MGTTKRKNSILAWVIAVALCLTMSPLVSPSGAVQAADSDYDYKVVALDDNGKPIEGTVVIKNGKSVNIGIVDSNGNQVKDYSDWIVNDGGPYDETDSIYVFDGNTRELTARSESGYAWIFADNTGTYYDVKDLFVYVNDGYRAFIKEDGERIWNYTMKEGETTHTFVIETEPADVAVEWTWKSADTTVATVDSNGMITVKKPGYTNISATSNLKYIKPDVDVYNKCGVHYAGRYQFVAFPETGKATISYIDFEKKYFTAPATVKDENDIKYKANAIGYEACKESHSLTKLTIGSNIKSIGDRAFYKCPKLKKVIMKSKKVPKIGKNAFKGISKKVTFKVPKSKLKAYKKALKKAGTPKTAKYRAI